MTIVTAGTSSHLTWYNSSVECDDEPYAHRLNSSQHDRGAVWRRTTNGNHSVLRGYVGARRRLPRGCLVPKVDPDVSRWHGPRPAVRRPRHNPRRRVVGPSRRLLTGARVPARLRQPLRNWSRRRSAMLSVLQRSRAGRRSLRCRQLPGPAQRHPFTATPRPPIARLRRTTNPRTPPWTPPHSDKLSFRSAHVAPESLTSATRYPTYASAVPCTSPLCPAGRLLQTAGAGPGAGPPPHTTTLHPLQPSHSTPSPTHPRLSTSFQRNASRLFLLPP